MVRSLDDALRLVDAQSPEGIRLLQQLAYSGDAKALFALAQLSWSGTIVAQDPILGRQLLEQAAARGHGNANILVTNLLASGVAGKRDWAAAVERLNYEASVLSGRAPAARLLRAMRLDAAGDPLEAFERRTISHAPFAFIVESLLTREECAYLIETGQELFEPSMVYDESHQLVRDTIRTSDGASIQWDREDPAVHAINRRIAAATRTAYEAGEALQLLRYAPGQEYRPHFDWLSNAPNQRLWTALVYLNEDYEGGETAFVRTNIKVKGRTGDMLVFSNADTDGNGDPLAEHAGLPVTSGSKLLATRWIHEARWIP